MKILVTSGPTREPIDGIRYISNFSSGRTGAEIADHLIERGHEVILLSGVGSAIPKRHGELSFHAWFGPTADLKSRLKSQIQDSQPDWIIHLAAVSDYCVSAIRMRGKWELPPQGKIDSRSQLQIRLKPTPKLVLKLKSYSTSKKPGVIAFKLTHGPLQGPAPNKSDGLTPKELKSVLKLSLHSEIDYVVHNRYMESLCQSSHRFRIFQKDKCIDQGFTKAQLAESLEKLVNPAGGPLAASYSKRNQNDIDSRYRQ